MDRVDRLERLLDLIAALLATDRPLKAEELRVRVPGYPDSDVAFHRAFNRDKATLRSMGVPLETTEIRPGDPEAGQGYRVRRQRYALPDPGLEPAEVAALELAATAVRFEGGATTEAIWKLGGVPREAELPTGALSAELPGGEHLATLFDAAASRRTVRFAYVGSSRLVDPWQLSFRNGFWYLAGWDRERRARRTFRLDRLSGAPELCDAGPFVDRPEASTPAVVPPWQTGDEEPRAVAVLVDAGQARFAVDGAGESAVRERRGDGSVVLTLEVTNGKALRSWVLGFLDHAEILSPESERAALVDWVRRGSDRWP